MRMSKRDFLAGSGLSAIAVAVVAFSPVMATESNKQLSSIVGNAVLVSVEERLGKDPLLAVLRYTLQPELKDRYKSHNGYTTGAIFGVATCRNRPKVTFRIGEKKTYSICDQMGLLRGTSPRLLTDDLLTNPLTQKRKVSYELCESHEMACYSAIFHVIVVRRLEARQPSNEINTTFH